MMTWIAALSLRLRLYLLGAAGVAVALLYLWGRWKIAAASAASAKARADSLEATRALEVRVAERRAALATKQRKIREQIAGETGRDGFSDQGWGP